MYLSSGVRSFFRSLMVFVSGVVVGAFIIVGAVYSYFMYFGGTALIDSYLARHHYPTRKDYYVYISQVIQQNEVVSDLNSNFNDLKVQFVNTVRQLPLRSPPIIDDRSLKSNDSLNIASSNLTARDKLDQQCAIWVLKYSSDPSHDLQAKIDKNCY